MLDLLQFMATPYIADDRKISVPEMRQQSQLVRIRWQRPDTTLSVRIDAMAVPRVIRRDYRTEIRCASSRCDAARQRDQNTHVPNGSAKFSSKVDNDWRHSQSNWIKGKRNGIARSHPYGARTVRACCCKEGAIGWKHMEADIDSQGFNERSRQRSK